MRLPWSPRGDPQPTDQVAVVLATDGRPLSARATEQAAQLASGGSVAVVTIARIHGFAFGLQNPGLLPTRRERDEQRALVESAIAALKRAKVSADGQVAITRNAGKVIAKVALTRGAPHVVMDADGRGRLRRLVEGDPVRVVRRRLRGRATVVVVPP